MSLWSYTVGAEPLLTTPLSIDAIAQHPAVQGLVIAPDGKHMAGLVGSPNHKWPVISIWDIDNLSGTAVWIPSTTMRPLAVSFLGNDRLLFFADQPFDAPPTRSFTVQAIVTDLQGRSFTQPFASKGTLSDTAKEIEKYGINFTIIQAGSLQNPDRYLVLRANVALGTTEVLALDTKSMTIERVARAADDESFVVADKRDGQLMVKERLRSADDGFRVVREVRNRSTGAWEEHPELGYSARQRVSITPLGFFEADPNKLYVSTNRDSNFAQIRIYDVGSKTWDREAAFSSSQADISDVMGEYDDDRKQVVGPLAYTSDGPAKQTVFLDDYWSPIQRGLEKQFPGRRVLVTSRNKSLGRALVEVSGPRHPPEFYILLNGKELKLVGRSSAAIARAPLGDTKFVSFKARDGIVIPAFLTTPPGYAKERHGRIPLVVLPHGGPWMRNFLDWDPSAWPQFLATRGYAVLQPQYRGSTGWGMALWKAGDAQWGQKMSDDNDDGALWLVGEGIADSQKLAILGYSYGGFAAMAATVRDNTPYRCAISGAGVSDLQRLGNLWGSSRVAREVQGWTVQGMNPLANVGKAKIPIMLFHGDRDTQAETRHSRDFYSAMKSAGKDVEYHEIKDMWHQLPWWPEWHRETLGLIENYLAGPKCFGAK
jgi:dipeptidyl aminopeptidase/acylaminoacyl peptidase